MLDIIYDSKVITTDSLTKPGFAEKVERSIQILKEERDIGELHDIVMALDKALVALRNFELDYPELYNRYKLLLIKAKYYCFSFITQKEAYELINKNLLLALQEDIDIIRLCRDRFDMYYDDDLDRVERLNITRALLNNTEKIGTNYIERADKRGGEPPIIKNWILDYTRHSPPNKLLSNVDEITYAGQNENVRKLKPLEKELLLKILRFYDFLRFPEIFREVRPTEHRVEEREPVRPVYPERIVLPIVKPTPSMPVTEVRKEPGMAAPSTAQVSVPRMQREELPSNQSLIEAFQDYKKFQDQILRVEDQIMTKTQGDINRIKRELSNAALAGDKNTLIACLKILARDGSLMNVLQDHPAWFAAIAESTRKKYTTSYSQGVIEQMISNAKLNPGNPALLSEFLQYLLKERLGMNENDSALVGLEIGQMLFGDNQRFCFGNEATGQFEWVKHMIANGQLVSEL